MIESARLGEVTQHLGHEEGVSVGLVTNGVGELGTAGIERLPGCGFQEGDDAGLIESLHGQVGDAMFALERRQKLGQGVLRGQLAAVGADDEEP